MRFNRQKLGRAPEISVLSSSYLHPWGTKQSEWVPIKVALHTPSVDWPTESSPLCDRGIKTNKHSTRKVFLDNGESLVN